MQLLSFSDLSFGKESIKAVYNRGKDQIKLTFKKIHEMIFCLMFAVVAIKRSSTNIAVISKL